MKRATDQELERHQYPQKALLPSRHYLLNRHHYPDFYQCDLPKLSFVLDINGLI